MSEQSTTGGTAGGNDGSGESRSNRSIVLIGFGTALAILAAGWLLSQDSRWLLPVTGFVVVLAALIAREGREGGTRLSGVAAGIAGSLVIGAVASAIPKLPEWLDADWSALILVPAGIWLAMSLVVGMLRKTSETPRHEGLWSWILAHKAIAGSIMLVFVSAAGLVHETQFYSRLGLSAMHYVDPGSLAYVMLTHWQLGLAGVGGAVVALVVVMWLWQRSSTWGKWGEGGGPLSVHVRESNWTQMAMWFLSLPARSLALVRTLVVVVTSLVFLSVPMAVAAVVAEDAWEGIGRQCPGTLRLSGSAMFVARVRHVASTSDHMILVHGCGSEIVEGGCPADRSDTSLAEFPRRLWLALSRLAESVNAGHVDNRLSRDGLECWRPIIVPWSSVASFDLGIGEPGTRSDATETANDGCSGNCAPAWKPDPHSQRSGPVGPQGDSIDIQYSRHGTSASDWSDEPTQDVRFIRFRVGDGEWEPPEGIRISGSAELWYGVSYNRFRLTEDIESQLDVNVVPSIGPQSAGGRCRFEVWGCASKTPFLHACGEDSGATCTACEGRTCHAWLTRIDGTGNAESYLRADAFVKYVEDFHDFSCTEMRECVEEINRRLNCGVANLRALATAGGLNSSTVLSVLKEHDLSSSELANEGDGSVPATAVGLLRACESVKDGHAHGAATLRAAKRSGSSQCWRPKESRVNHMAIIRVTGDGAGTFGGCLQGDTARLETS